MSFYDGLQRITISEILEDEWFKKGYKRPVFEEKYEGNFNDVEAAFKDSEVSQNGILTLKVFVEVSF